MLLILIGLTASVGVNEADLIEPPTHVGVIRVPPALTDRFTAAADRAPRTDPGRGFVVVPRGCPPVMTRCRIAVPAGTYRRTVHRQTIVGIMITLIFTDGIRHHVHRAYQCCGPFTMLVDNTVADLDHKGYDTPLSIILPDARAFRAG